MPKNKIEAVILKARSYTWQCPGCSYVQGEPVAYEAVTCKRCKTLYEVTEHEHKLD